MRQYFFEVGLFYSCYLIYNQFDLLFHKERTYSEPRSKIGKIYYKNNDHN